MPFQLVAYNAGLSYQQGCIARISELLSVTSLAACPYLQTPACGPLARVSFRNRLSSGWISFLQKQSMLLVITYICIQTP